MRITIVIGGLTGGGAERVAVNLANAWVARGHRVTLLTMAKNLAAPAYAIDSQVELRDIGWPRVANSEELNAASVAPVVRHIEQADCPELLEQLTLIVLLRHAILATSPDTVVAHIDLTNLRVLAAMSETGVPVIACEHTDTTLVSLGRWQKARDRLYPGAFAVVASHQTSADWLTRRGARALAIPNPLVAPPARLECNTESPAHFEPGAERRRLVTLARLSPEKRLDLLIRAFARVAEDFPEWDLEIYGEGASHDFLARLIAGLAPGRAHLRGFVKDPYAILYSADLFVSASWVEGFGNAIWEALSCGIPVVAMDGGAAVRTLVRDGVDGLIVRENRQLVPALASLMGDERARKALAARAPEVLTRFSMESALLAWDALLDKAAAQSSS